MLTATYQDMSTQTQLHSLFLHVIPDTECLVAPIVEYNYKVYQDYEHQIWFKIKIPHYIKKISDLKTIKVRHGDIHKNLSFVQLPTSTCHFDVDPNRIIIHTQHFSQFTCTSCRKLCQAGAKAFIFGTISTLQYKPITATVRLYLASPLYQIQDYYKVCTVQAHHSSCQIVSDQTVVRDPEQHAKLFSLL